MRIGYWVQEERHASELEAVRREAEERIGELERSLEGTGLEPDEVVRSPRAGTTDLQLERAIEYLEEKLR